jgi:hypothetical protein
MSVHSSKYMFLLLLVRPLGERMDDVFGGLHWCDRASFLRRHLSKELSQTFADSLISRQVLTARH